MNLKPLQDFSGEERSILGLFGIDVGNHDTKSRHTVFASGYKKDCRTSHQLDEVPVFTS